jgi:hypothetical protein
MAANFAAVHARCVTAEAVQHDAFGATEPIGEFVMAPMIQLLRQPYARR